MKIGIIGTGNMGFAIAKGLIESGYRVSVCNRSTRNLEELKAMQADITESLEMLIEESDLIFLAVKPKDILSLIGEVKPFLEYKTVISIAAGITLETLREAASDKVKFVRVMPNTPALISKGVFGVVSDGLDEKTKDMVFNLLSAIGEPYFITEADMHAFIAIAGSSPAYIYMFMEALSDAGVKLGMKRSDTYDIIADTLIGAGLLYKKTKEHPGILKDMVTSPKGTTIEAVRTLETMGFRSAVIEGALASGEKSKEMEDAAKAAMKQV
ncbi:MAG TPA: pyrroline-5-carboxylate reductase [Clostridiaceae bacterium]|nr:pyrroline-5-carboxylate reductase [Clostridiaceae bacterium]